MLSKFRKAAEIYRELGPGKAFRIIRKKMLKQFLALFYEKIDDVIISWDLNLEKKFKIRDQLSVEHLKSEDLPELVAFCQHNHMPDYLPRKFANYIDNGFKGFAVMHDTKMVGFMWYVDNSIPEQHNHPALTLYDIRLQDGEVYMFDNFLLPEFRGNANSIEGLYHMRVALLESGYHRALAYVRASNRPAKWIYAVHGWKNERNYIRHKIFRSILIGNRRVFIKNSQWSAVHKFDYRMIMSLR